MSAPHRDLQDARERSWITTRSGIRWGSWSRTDRLRGIRDRPSRWIPRRRLLTMDQHQCISKSGADSVRYIAQIFSLSIFVGIPLAGVLSAVVVRQKARLLVGRPIRPVPASDGGYFIMFGAALVRNKSRGKGRMFQRLSVVTDFGGERSIAPLIFFVSTILNPHEPGGVRDEPWPTTETPVGSV